ncbi:MAG: cupin domain-containing protein [Anaerolineae bacterium]|nr:cupin domain-containing protein [Anaerolineae bacterium]
MRIDKADTTIAKGWYLGPWNADLDISIGFANAGVDEPHLHRQMTEIYLIARGSVEMRVEQLTITLVQDDVIVIEPGEAHTFLNNSPDYFHFVIHTLALQDEAAKVDKVPVSRERLGL